ncbi:hypothetical protein Y032_0204g1894 [Ancylostoma ceylanicum]|uniref:C-type lectin domain-containing protein n=1 Tax=Ancylostoma ceylanicum TaxID=53326 RepID=A0A016SMS7_9BILA|nr:hypothetical protein Y032_0204g1894 [Ancylostoma ceylanicum]
MLLLLFAVVSSVLAECPIGTTYHPEFNRCYLFVSDPQPFGLAEDACAANKGHVVSVTNGFENAMLAEHVSSVNRVSDRIISLRIATKDGFWTVVSVYAPQCGCTEADKEAFYEELDDVIRSAPEGDFMTVAGDFNGHVGQDRQGFERVHGGISFGRRNQEGEGIIELAEVHDLAIASTFFIKRESQKITYCSGGRQSEIDHILVRRQFLKTVKDVKTIPGEEIAGQHRPVVADVCIALPKQTKAVREPRIRWWKLTGETQKTFREKIAAVGLPDPCGLIDPV